MNEFGAQAGLWGLFLSAFVSATLAPGGSEAVLAYLVHERHAPAVDLVAVASVGNTLGAMTTWAAGWFLARWRGLPLEVPGDARRRRAVEEMRRWGCALLLLSWLPLVGDGFCFAAGWLRSSLTMSLLYIALGKTLRYAVIAWLAV
ncbi:MAG TPA: DedA family protein [Methylococcus sp.]|nr:DedA family protein [Methylococcus sp.]